MNCAVTLCGLEVLGKETDLTSGTSHPIDASIDASLLSFCFFLSVTSSYSLLLDELLYGNGTVTEPWGIADTAITQEGRWKVQTV